MAVLAIVTSSPPGVEGGHLVIARSLVAAARAAGHDAHLVITPDYGFGHQAAAYYRTWRTDVSRVNGARIDQVISLRYPSYAVRHPRHVCWLNHTMREYYDLWPQLTASISLPNLAKETVRKVAIHGADRYLLKQNVTRVTAQSATIQRRLLHDFDLHADVLYPPAPQRPYRCDRYDDYIFAVSRLTAHKRLDLLIRALANAAARHVRAVIAGDGDERPRLEALAGELDVADRVTFLGRIDDDALVSHYGRCRAVCFVPAAEDYGFVTVEAFASRKAVLTCLDSGGPAELVQDGVNGFVCEPTAPSLAGAMTKLLDGAALAERLGAAAFDAGSRLTWPETIKQLVQ